jgi:hypothetical protein
MKKYFQFNTSIIVSRIAVFGILFYVMVLSSYSGTNLKAVFKDAVDIYHQGELMGNVWHMISYYKLEAPFPVFIHGAMDYWPSLIAQFCFSSEHIIYGTRFILVFATLISWLLFLNLGITLLRRAGGDLIHYLFFIGIFILTIPYSDFTVMAIEESPIGLRDLIVLCQTYLLFLYFDSSNIRKKYYLGLVFFLLPVAICWAYDRGVASSFGCLVVIILLVKQKKIIELLIVFSAVTLSLGLLEVSRIGGTVFENIRNVMYWAEHSKEVWGLPFHYGFGSLLHMLPIFSLLLLGVYLNNQKANISPDKFIFFIFLFIVELFLLKSGLNRPTLQRILMSSWPSVLILLALANSKVQPNSLPINPLVNCNPSLNFRSIALIGLLIPIALFQVPTSTTKITEFVRIAMNPPKDSYLAGEAVINAAKGLEGQGCSVNWVNQGIITLMSKTKHCTKFPYMVYASQSEQTILMEELHSSHPISIIINSNDWSSEIDGRTMQSRLPILFNYLNNTFTQTTLVNNYTLLTKTGSF